MKVAINGFGRIGRAFLKNTLPYEEIEVVYINDLSSKENLAYLFNNDSIYREKYDFDVNEKGFLFNNNQIIFSQEKEIEKLNWKDVDIVIEATGVFREKEILKKYLNLGVKKVILTSTFKDSQDISLLGINDSDNSIISNGSCTTNAVANFLNILDKEIGVKKAVLNTIHAYTANQNLVDNASKDFLRGRNANLNIIPTTTNAALAVTNSLKNLKDKFNGLSVRVPVACGSLADVTFVSNKPTSKEEIQKIILKNIQKEEYADLISANYSLVSSDIIQTSFLGIIDLDLIQVVDKDLIKICVWYDNEWGYAYSLVLQVLKNKLN